MRTIEWKDGTVTTIDQTKLPNQTVLLKMTSCDEIAEAIKTMQIRGAPLLGAAAAYGLALTAYHSKAKDKRQLIEELTASAQILKKTRPTAVNLFGAIDRMMKKAGKMDGDAMAVVKAVVEEAKRIANEDVDVNRKIGEYGSTLIDSGDTVLTHCNAGSLATVDYGTALGVIRTAWKKGKGIKIIATETRPLLQGARLTAYELFRDGIPVTLITDSMVGYVMSKGFVNKVVVGADRIVKDAVVNKIGTYMIAVLAHEHKVPFYVAAPNTTFDMEQSAKDVVVEERSIEEVVKFGGVQVAPKGVSAFNPAFDITPLKYVTAIIYEKGIISPANFQKISTV
ncbi:MAG: S-methyl-5-thioribose-1-phosphate isomerase [Candidatus Bathyarchaeota archaeon]|nr:S-methyl-5-thioribose-1-phosphate isomerase [Candidatus Bathyarchaeota archaeon]MDH5494800.1 S-methyl-5-thioribose-1-phosphate isomerase [Candidatus Bathyarchaeota archaeon]